jgi:hypothetical protein
MVIRGILFSILWLGILPFFIGTIYEKKCEMRQIPEAWVCGLLTMMAAAQVVLVPCIALRGSFSLALVLWLAAVILLFAVALFQWFGKRKFVPGDNFFGMVRAHWVVLLALAAVLVQCLMAAALQHSDADDSRFVAEAVIAVEQDSMYVISPISGEPMFKVDYLGDVKKDLTSPWVMFFAFLSRLCTVPPAVLSHSILPFYLVLFCYVVYALIGRLIFEGNPEKTALFLLFLSAFFAFDYSSTHTVGTVMLFRIWQGKAFAAAGIVPLLFYLFFCYVRQQKEVGCARKTLLLFVVSSFASSLVSGIGILLSLLLTAVFGLALLVVTRKAGRAVRIWLTALPALGYLVCQYEYWPIFVARWFN